jgi:metal-sulfur cluster biosynthetic enzyme
MVNTEAGPILAALATVMDPELGIDIVSMGLVRGIALEGKAALVQMTLSTRGCPVGPAILRAVEEAIVSAGYEAKVELVWSPPWTPSEITSEGRARIAAR